MKYFVVFIFLVVGFMGCAFKKKNSQAVEFLINGTVVGSATETVQTIRGPIQVNRPLVQPDGASQIFDREPFQISPEVGSQIHFEFMFSDSRAVSQPAIAFGIDQQTLGVQGQVTNLSTQNGKLSFDVAVPPQFMNPIMESLTYIGISFGQTKVILRLVTPPTKVVISSLRASEVATLYTEWNTAMAKLDAGSVRLDLLDVITIKNDSIYPISLQSILKPIGSIRLPYVNTQIQRQRTCKVETTTQPGEDQMNPMLLLLGIGDSLTQNFVQYVNQPANTPTRAVIAPGESGFYGVYSVSAQVSQLVDMGINGTGEYHDVQTTTSCDASCSSPHSGGSINCQYWNGVSIAAVQFCSAWQSTYWSSCQPGQGGGAACSDALTFDEDLGYPPNTQGLGDFRKFCGGAWTYSPRQGVVHVGKYRSQGIRVLDQATNFELSFSFTNPDEDKPFRLVNGAIQYQRVDF